jgi:flagellar hook assembly protein FlgD
LKIIDLNGKIIKEGYCGYKPAGYHTYKWIGMNQKDEIMPSGIYIYKAEANGYIQTGKMVLMK